MDGVGIGHFHGADNRRNIQITIGGTRGADADRFIGEADMHQIFVRAGVNGNRPDSQRLAGAQHAKRYFSTVGYNNFFKHERFLEKMGFGF